jgi:hypothetical protein
MRSLEEIDDDLRRVGQAYQAALSQRVRTHEDIAQEFWPQLRELTVEYDAVKGHDGD